MSKLVLLFFLIMWQAACANQASPAISRGSQGEVQCLAQFLLRDSDWSADVFSWGRRRPLMQSKVAGKDPFFPVQRILVVGGQLYVSTWRAELKPVKYHVKEGHIFISPKYLYSLGVGDEISRSADMVAEYNKPNVLHRLEIVGECARPSGLKVDISADTNFADPMHGSLIFEKTRPTQP